jgi:hypothetical protein
MTTLDGRFNHFWPMLKQRASAIYSLPAPAESAPASACDGTPGRRRNPALGEIYPGLTGLSGSLGYTAQRPRCLLRVGAHRSLQLRCLSITDSQPRIIFAALLIPTPRADTARREADSGGLIEQRDGSMEPRDGILERRDYVIKHRGGRMERRGGAIQGSLSSETAP